MVSGTLYLHATCESLFFRFSNRLPKLIVYLKWRIKELVVKALDEQRKKNHYADKMYRLATETMISLHT